MNKETLLAGAESPEVKKTEQNPTEVMAQEKNLASMTSDQPQPAKRRGRPPKAKSQANQPSNASQVNQADTSDQANSATASTNQATQGNPGQQYLNDLALLEELMALEAQKQATMNAMSGASSMAGVNAMPGTNEQASSGNFNLPGFDMQTNRRMQVAQQVYEMRLAKLLAENPILAQNPALLASAAQGLRDEVNAMVFNEPQLNQGLNQGQNQVYGSYIGMQSGFAGNMNFGQVMASVNAVAHSASTPYQNASQGSALNLNTTPSKPRKMVRGKYVPDMTKVTELVDGTLKESDTAGYFIDSLDVQVSAGFGAFSPDYTASERVFIPEVDFQRWLGNENPSNLKVIKITGNSMEPRLHDGQSCVVRLTNEFTNSGIYVFSYEDQLYIKRLVTSLRGFTALSDNPDYQPMEIENLDSFMIHGRLVLGLQQAFTM